MTPFEQQIMSTAQSMAKLAQSEYAELPAGQQPDWSLMEQRFAVLMVQARAQECRHLAGSLMINVGAAMSGFAMDLTERSHTLENIALEMAKQWPPVFLDGPNLVQ